MSAKNEFKHYLTWIGLALSVIVGMVTYCNWNKISANKNELEIIISSLAFIWLVIGYHQNNVAIRLQAKELHDSVKEFKTHSKIMSDQSQALEGQHKIQKREMMVKLNDLVLQQAEYAIIQIAQKIAHPKYLDYAGRSSRDVFFPGHGNLYRLVKELNHELKTNQNYSEVRVMTLEQNHYDYFAQIKSLYTDFFDELRKQLKDDVYTSDLLISNNPVRDFVDLIDGILLQTVESDIEKKI